MHDNVYYRREIQNKGVDMKDDMDLYVIYNPHLDKICLSRKHNFNEYIGHWIILGVL